MHARVQIASIAFAVAVLAVVFELVRRRKLSEKYALLWMTAAAALLLLAAWQQLLYKISHAVGIYYPPTTFLVIAFGFVLLLLLNFSTASSRLADDTRLLAQRVALLEAQLASSEQQGTTQHVAEVLETPMYGNRKQTLDAVGHLRS